MKGFVLLFMFLAVACNHSRNHNGGFTHIAPEPQDTISNKAAQTKTAKRQGTLISKTIDTINPKTIVYAGPATIVYKTNADYYDKVPVILSDDKTKIVSYPAPGDVYYNGVLSYPTKLSNGYLLDNRGISKNVAFLNITYEDYSKLTNVPSPDELMGKITDKSPLVEMYNMGSRYQYKDITADINKIITSGQLVRFKRLY